MKLSSEQKALILLFLGDGSNYINGVGAIGDKTYISEANTGNFSCPGEVYQSSCDVLNTFITSSAQLCNEGKWNYICIYEWCL